MAEDRTIRYRVTAATQGFQQGMARSASSAQQASGRITRSMQRNQQALQAAGVAGIGMGVALGTGLATAVSAGADFQAEMNQVRAVSGATGEDFEALSGVAREMGRSTKFGATEAAEGLSFLSMAGFEAQESVEALPGVLDLAAAGGMELGRSADIASNVLQGFGLEAGEAGRVVDTMAATFTSSNTSLEQMGRSLSFVAPVANSAGLELEETAAAIGLMGDAGIQGCYDDQTEVLTDRGWVYWPDVAEGDRLASVDPDTHEMTFERPSELFVYDHDGPMYRVANRNLDLSVTPNHRMYVRRRDHDEWEVAYAEDIAGKQVDYLAHVGWQGDDSDAVKVAGFDQWRGSWWKPVAPVEVDATSWARLLGYYLSEGSKDYRKGTYRISIAQQRGERHDRMFADLQALPWLVRSRGDKIIIYSEQLYRALPDGKAWEKSIPADVKGMSSRLLAEFLAAFTLGDGDDNGALYTSSKALADDLCEVALKCGHATSVVARQGVGDRSTMTDGRVVTAAHQGWKVNVRTRQTEPTFSPYEYRGKHGSRLDQSKGARGEWWEHYTGKVYCAEVPGGLMVVRRNGKAVVSGNSRAGTAMRQSIARLLRPVGQAKEVINELGLSVTTSGGQLRSMTDIMGQLEDAGANTADVVGLFGQEAGPAMAALLERGSGALDDFADDLEDSGGAAKRVADTQMEGLKGSMTELGSAIEGLQIRIAEDGGLLDGLAGIADVATSATQAMEGLPDSVIRTGTTAATAAGSLSLLGGAAAIAGPRVADMVGHLGGIRRVAVRGGAIVTVITAISNLNHAFQEARREGEAMAQGIIENADTVEEALTGLNTSLEEHIEESNDASSVAGRLGNALLGPIGAYRGAKSAIDDAGVALELWSAKSDAAAEFAEDFGAAADLARGDVNNLTGAVLGLDDATAQRGPTRERADALDEEGDAAARTAAKLDEVSGSLENLSGTQQDAVDALAGGVDTFDTYQGLLDDRKDAEREAADATFEAARDTITAQRDAGAISSEVAQDRIDAARDARDAEVDALDDIGDSWDTFQQAQQDTLDDQREWMANLRDLRERGFDDLADDLAARGPEQAGLVAEAADQSNEALREGEQRAMAIREQNAEAALAQIQSSGENMVSASGAVSDEVVDEIADKLGVLPDDVRGILADTDTVVEGQMRAVGETFGKGAEGAVRQMADRLNAGSEEVAGIVSRYASLIARGIQPVMEGIGASRTAQALQRFVAGDRITGLAAGGIADEPTVMVGEGPGPEAVIPMYEGMGATRERNVALWEYTGRQLGMDLTGGADRRMAAGGVLPPVPGMAAHGDMLGSSGEAAMERTREEAVLFLERQAPEPMARGGIIARGGEPVASRQPDRAAGSQTVDRSVKVGQVVAHDYDDFIAQMGRSQRVAALQGTRR